MNVSRGQKLAGVVLVAFGLLTMLVAVLVCGAGLLGLITLVFDPFGDRTAWAYILGLCLCGMLVYTAGKSMIFAGDYIQGRMRGIPERIMLFSCLFCIVRDLLFLLTGMFLIVAFISAAMSHWVISLSSLGAAMGCHYMIIRVKGKIASLGKNGVGVIYE